MLLSINNLKFYFCFAIIAIATLASSSAVNAMTPKPPLQPTGTGMSATEQFNQCLMIAKQGEIESAISRARDIKANFATQRMVDISYINTLISMVEETEAEKRLDTQILNECIALVNELRRSNRYSGQVDPEAAYHFMNSLDRLAKALAPLNARVASKVGIFEGNIALQLKSNPNYPRNAMEALGRPLFAKAQGHAIRKEKDAAINALKSAMDVGFGDFELIEKNLAIQLLVGKEGSAKLMDDLKGRYQTAIDDWSKTVVAQFQPFAFEFDVNNIQGGRISRADYLGKVVVVDLWATWCPPCRKGIPHYIELQERYQDSGVAVVGISMDNPSDPQSSLQEVRDFVSKAKFNYDCGIGDQSITNMLPGKTLLPTTIFLDRNGMVRYIARGYHDYAKIEALTKVLASEKEMVGAASPTFYGN